MKTILILACLILTSCGTASDGRSDMEHAMETIFQQKVGYNKSKNGTRTESVKCTSTPDVFGNAEMHCRSY